VVARGVILRERTERFISNVFHEDIGLDAATQLLGNLGFMVEGLRFRVWGFECRV